MRCVFSAHFGANVLPSYYYIDVRGYQAEIGACHLKTLSEAAEYYLP